MAQEAAAGAPVRESVIGTDDRVRVAESAAFPWATIARVVADTPAGTVQGTGVLVGPSHLLTAGHVVHSDAFGGDGWASAITVAPGQDGAVEPFGRAEAVAWRAPEAWLEGEDPGADWALVTLDRSLGTAIGTLDLAAPLAPEGAPVTLAGFPGDLESGRTLYAAAGTIARATEDRLFYAGTLDTAGGMSGAPIWQTFSGSGRREVLGVHTSGAADPSAPGAENSGVRLTEAALTLIDEWIDLDRITLPPDDRPDLADADTVFAEETAALSTPALAAGGAATLTVAVANLGTAPAAAPVLTAYLSGNATITEIDLEIGRVALAPLAPFERRTVAVEIALPASVPSGFYRVGWILADPAPEFSDANNTGLLAQSLEVAARPDATASGLVLSSLGWAPGESVAAAWEIVNAGAALAPPVGSGLYLSEDGQVTAEDRLLAQAPPTGLLGAGQAATLAPAPFTAPLDLPSGTYWVAALADPDGALDEADPANNASAPIAVTLSRPGLDLLGTEAADTLLGELDDDTLTGLGGADRLRGGGGRDDLSGGGDDDRLFGEAGGDRLLGGPGFDTLLGQEGDDLLEGDLGDGLAGQGDVLNGGPGADTLRGEGGADTLYGEDGADLLEGGPGFDLLGGNAGNDTLLGGDRRDTVDGGAGDDLLEGGEGNDAVYGGDGADTLRGGAGPDFIDGGAGDDRVEAGPDDDIVIAGPGADTVEGGAGFDRIQGGTGDDSVLAGEGPDRVFGEAGGDTILGGPGDDLLDGNEDDDRVLGEGGNDTLRGGSGSDTLEGGEGADALAGREGDDRLEGGPGADALDGEAGADTLSGGAEDDAVLGGPGADLLAGDAGADSVFGGADDDTLSGGPGPDRLAGDAGIDRFLFAAGDGADLVFDYLPGVETLVFTGGVARFADLTQGTDPAGWLTLGHSADPGDVVTLQGVRPGEIADDGTILFL